MRLEEKILVSFGCFLCGKTSSFYMDKNNKGRGLFDADNRRDFNSNIERMTADGWELKGHLELCPKCVEASRSEE